MIFCPHCGQEVEAIVHLLKHLDGSQVLAEATLGLILDCLAAWAFYETASPIGYSRSRALQTLSLVVQS